jgi:hypothetical protein
MSRTSCRHVAKLVRIRTLVHSSWIELSSTFVLCRYGAADRGLHNAHGVAHDQQFKNCLLDDHLAEHVLRTLRTLQRELYELQRTAQGSHPVHHRSGSPPCALTPAAALTVFTRAASAGSLPDDQNQALGARDCG